MLSFVAFLSSSPQLCAVVEQLSLYGCSNAGNPSEDDSWISSAPFLLPALPHLRTLLFINVDLSRQHTILDKALAKFRFTSTIEKVVFSHYLDVSLIVFSRLARLAHVLRAQGVWIAMCTFKAGVAETATVPRNIWPVNWMVWIRLDNENFGSDDSESCFTPHHEHLWSRMGQRFYHLVSAQIPRSISVNEDVTVEIGGHLIQISKSSDNQLELFLSASPEFVQAHPSSKLVATIEAVITTWSKILYLLRSCHFADIYADLQVFGIAWNWDEHDTLQTWKAVDDVLFQHYPALRFIDAKLPTFDPYGPPHHALFSHYGCVDKIISALLPQTSNGTRVRFNRYCHKPGCRHKSVQHLDGA
ncbi:hypothetical protein EUX98_g7540 [Antrodiella citrinella]|uniref:Uncharacterized protein n=1 Tax=Antrodiella citrinella TaxID=2447956 RepID=A0A4S4ML85_9APHY|nr:hypothetical protein EUX98_g7540 [Antrodiella citrinella]